MKNQIMRTVAILGVFIMLAIASVNAQTPANVEVTVPFDFSTGKVTLKAGRYIVKRTSANLLSIRSFDGKTTALINAPLSLSARDSKAGARLVFNNYGDQYFLSQVWMTVDTGHQIFVSGAEVKAAREYKIATNNAKPRRVEVAMQAR